MEPLIRPLLGGSMIGFAAALFWILNGRVAGVSGILDKLTWDRPEGRGWRASFVGGLLVGGLLLRLFDPAFLEGHLQKTIWVVALAGLLVGVGTAMARGCTSGHGICGVGRLSKRSLVATMVFIAAGVLTVALISRVGVL